MMGLGRSTYYLLVEAGIVGGQLGVERLDL